MAAKDVEVVLSVHSTDIERLLWASHYPRCQGSVAYQGQGSSLIWCSEYGVQGLWRL